MENEVMNFVKLHWLYQIVINENMQVIMKKKNLVNHQDLIDDFVRYKNVLNNYILQNVLHNNQEEEELQVDHQLDQDLEVLYKILMPFLYNLVHQYK